MRIKDGVRFASPQMAMMHASMAVAEVCHEMRIDFVVTGGCEGRRQTVPHGTGGALDYRANHIATDAQRYEFANRVRDDLGDGFDVLLHGPGAEIHLHVEYDPKDVKP